MTRRLLASYLGLAVLILLVLEVPFGFLATNQELGSARAAATRDATEIAVGSTEVLESGSRSAMHALLEDYFARTGAELAVVGRSGATVAEIDPDSDDDLVVADRLVREALAGASRSAIVYDEGRPDTVVAVPVGSSGHPIGAVLLTVPVGAYTDHIQDIWTGLAGFAAIVLALTVLVGLWLARSLSRPLAELEAAVSRLGEGDLAARVPSGLRVEEMRALGEAFNRMAERLEELVSAQSRFVADASHQLRSPLTALRLRLENLEAELDPVAGESMAAVGREVARLSRLVDGLLAISRADQAAPDAQLVEVARVIEERCDAWAALAAERRVGLVHTVGNGLRSASALLVPGDLDQVLDNLLANALDAAPPGSSIQVRLDPGPRRDRLAVHVVDEGPGMSAEDRVRAFDRFWQGPGGRRGHSGLGLAIVRQLVRRNRGDVVLLEAAGGGLDAVVSLRVAGQRPVVPPASARPSPDPARAAGPYR